MRISSKFAARLSTGLLCLLTLLLSTGAQFDELIKRLRNPVAIEVSFTASEYRVREDVGELTLCLSMEGGFPLPTSVLITSYQTSQPDSATDSVDFSATSGVLELPRSAMPTVTCINHTRIIDDNLALEGVESFVVSFEILGETLFGFRELELVPGIDKSTVSIIDNDVVTVELTQTNVTVDEGGGVAEVCVSVDMFTALPISLPIQALETMPSSAEASLDFIAEIKNVTIQPSNSADTTCIDFSILEDKLAFEGVETFSVQLLMLNGSRDGVLLGDNTTATVHILDNDNVTLTVETLERPQAERPIPGETVMFTCEVPSSLGIRWENENFTNPLNFLSGADSVGDTAVDSSTGAVVELLRSADTHISTLTFTVTASSALNTSEVFCYSASNYDFRNVEMVTLAGIPSPPVNVTVEEQRSCDCLTLTWATPLFDGGAPLIYTELQFYPNNTNTSTAARILRTADGSVERLEACDLVPNVMYVGSVWAVNDVGASEAVEVVMLINATAPPPALSLKAESRCGNPSLCFQGSLAFSWSPPLSDLLCPVFAVYLNYSITELGVLINSTSLTLRHDVTEYVLPMIAPGRAYTATVVFENEIGLSVNNPTVREDVLVFGSVLLQKLTQRGTIFEGETDLYAIRLNGPTPSPLTLNINNVDDFTRILTPPLFFNSTLWYERQDVVVMATDDDIIRDSPYGALVSLETISDIPKYQRMINLSVVIQDTDTATVHIARREVYPGPPDIPEGRWAVYLVSLPNQPTHPVTIVYHTLTPTITLSPFQMTFEPMQWNIPQELTVIAIDDGINMASPYESGFNLTLLSEDKNYDGQPLPDYNVTVEDNDRDAAVVAGTLTWRSASDLGRTAVLFTLSLTLVRSYYPHISASSVGVANVSLPGSFEFGSTDLNVIGLFGDYIITSGDILYHYRDYDDAFSSAEYEYCCRGESLINTQGTLFALSVDVDLTQATSPTLPTLPLVALTPSQASLQFFYSALHPRAHPLVYYFGDATNYHSSQGGPPQGLKISYSTGHVTWDPNHVIPGDYSVQVVVEDVFTGIKTSSELFVRVTTPTAYTPPTIVTPHTFLTFPTLYATPGSTLSTNITVYDRDSMLGLQLLPILPLPEGAWLSRQIITGANTVLYELLWEPTEEQIGEHLLCFVSNDGHGLSSPPSCLSVIVTENLVEQPALSLSGVPDSSFTQTFIKGVDQSVPIASSYSTLSSLSPTIEHMYISIVNYYDGQYESIEVANEFSHPSLSFGRSEPPSDDASSVVYFRGAASPAVYLEALQSLVYVNSKPRPTVGDRLISVIVFDGQSTNQIAYSMITVAIENIEPAVKVNGNEEIFSNRFFPHKGSVAATNPDSALIIDTDSEFIRSMTLQLYNVRNGASETLAITYVSPETLSLPVVAGATQLSVPLGTLWRGEEVPVITSTVHIDEMGVIGDLSVIIDIRHSWVGDLKVELEHDGRRELLVLSPGGQICDRDDLVRTTFESDMSSFNIHLSKSTSSPGVCRFRSQGLFTPDGDLGSFRGDAIEGDWMLHITDLSLEIDNGRLFGWSLLIQPEETHALIAHPPVIPPIKVGGARGGLQVRHEKQVELDGRITEISVHVQLGVDFLAEQLYLPTLTLVHPDGTNVVLSNWNIPFCAIGNYTNLVFSDRGQSSEFTCENVLNPMSGSGSGSGSFGSGTDNSGSGGFGSGTDNSNIATGQSGSGMLGSGSGISLNNGMYLDLDAIFNLNISIPYKYSQADILSPARPLSSLRGKLAGGKWTLVLSSDNRFESTLYAWSLRVAREPNINPNFDSITSTLYLIGDDSVSNYQTVLRSIVYDNTAVEPDFSVQRAVTTVVNDGGAVSNISLASSLSTITVHHVDIDLDPLNTTTALTPGFYVTFVEHSVPIPILASSNAILGDEAYDSGEYVLTATLKGYRNFDEEGLIVNTSATSGLRALITNNSDTQELSVVVTSTSPQPIERFQAVLRTIEYFNNAEEFVGENRTVEFQVTDFQMDSFFVSDIAVATIILQPTNDLPVLLLNSPRYTLGDQYSNIVDYTEGQGPRPLTNASAILLTDNDHDYLLSVTITITNPQDPSNEFLQANTSGTSISSEYNVTTYTLSLSGMGSLDTYIIVLGTVTYENTVHSPGMPGTEPRQITFVPYDGTHEGAPAISLVTFAAVNDPAFGDLNGALPGTGYTVTFIEERGPVSIVSENSTLYDVDDHTLSYIDVRILNAVDAPYEVLAVMSVEESSAINSKVTEFTNLRPITSYDSDTGSLKISGLDSVREYQEVLKTLTYDNIADEPTQLTRMIEVTLNDSHSTSIPLEITVEIELVNDSPYFDELTPLVLVQISEDVPNLANTGVTVLDVAELIVDDDLGAVKGMAIVGLDSENGVWEYTSDGVNWNELADNVTVSFALTLEATIGVAVRFVPVPDWNGIVTITVVAWDTTDNSLPMTYINAQSNSSIDAFSFDTTVITIVVLPVNDAPLLQQVPLNLTSILEDDQTSAGDPVLSLVQNVTDVDLPVEFGIAVVDADQQNGTWQFTTDGGMLWEEFGIVNETSALLLQSLPQETHRVRFVPDSDFNGMASFRFFAWDLTQLPLPEGDVGSAMMQVSSASGSGLSGSGSGMFASGVLVNETLASPPLPYPSGTRFINTFMSDPITGPFSVVSTSVTIVIEPVNDSPVIVPGMSLENIMEDTDPSFNHGTMVRNIIRGFYTDIDAYPELGLAVIQVDDRYGSWQYTCQNPSVGNWSTFIGGMYYGQIIPRLPQPEMATLLLSTCWIRFLPNQFFNSELNRDGYPRTALPYIVAHGWDDTGATAGLSGSYGNDATYASNSITNEYSANAERITINVTSVNNVPTLRLANQMQAEYSTVYVEDGHPVFAVGRQLSLVDNDHARLRDVTVTVYGSQFDVSPFEGIVFSGDSVSIVEGSGSTSGSASGMGSGSGSGLVSGSGIDPVIEPGEYIPVISSTSSYPPLGSIQEYVRNLLSPTPRELYCSGLTERREELLVEITSPDLISEVISYCPFVLRLSANLAVAPDAHKDMFQLALRSLKYNNSIEEPEAGNRILTFVVSDNVGLSEPVNSTVFVQLVNDPPQLDLNALLPDMNNFVQYTEGQGLLLLSNETILRLIDHDHTHLQYSRVVLTEAPDANHEILNATINGTSINLDFDNSTHTLTLYGNETVAVYREVLSTVTYTNLYSHPGNPDERQREVQFFVSDGQNESMVAISYISFTGVNNRPYLDLNGDSSGVNYTVVFVEEQGPVNIVDENVLVHDEDNSSLAYIQVQLVDPEFLCEILSVDNVTLSRVLEQSNLNTDKIVQVTTLVPNMTYDDMNGILTISGLDTVEEYQLVLRTIKYNNVLDEPIPGCRLVKFTANDGELDSTPVYTEVCVEGFNDSPYFNTSVPTVYSPLILEDEMNNEGVMVPMFAYLLFADDDRPMIPRRGIAVVSVETENGDWEYSIDGGNSWNMIHPDTNISSTALLLDAELDSDSLVRFIPDENFNGNASLTFVLWDDSDNMVPGVTRSALSLSPTDPFSNDTRTMVLRVVPVNDAPVIDPTIQPEMTDIREDAVRERESLGDEVEIFLSPLLDDVDVDAETHQFGIAVVGVDESNGYWQFSVSGGQNWTNMTLLSEADGIVLDSQPAGWNRIRFVPNPDFNGMSSFQYKLWDRNVTLPSGMVGVDTLAASITHTFSVDVATARLTVEPVNDSPLLAGPGVLTDIQEDIAPAINFGTFVSDLLDPIFNDIDGTDTPGIAVVFVDRRYGNWQWSCDSQSATTWRDFRGERLQFESEFGTISQVAPLHPNEFRATLLSGSTDSLCRIRFLPSPDYNSQFDRDGFPRDQNDRPFITVRAWDVTEGESEDEGVDTTSEPDDHTNAFGLEFVRVSINVLTANDVPIVMLNGNFPNYITTFVEPIPPQRKVVPVPIVNQTGLSLTDPDNALLTMLNIAMVIYDGDSERLLVDTSGTTLNYTVSTLNEPTGVLYVVSVSPSSGTTAPIEEFETVLRNVLYENSAEEPHPADRTVSVTARDELGFGSSITLLSITLLNDPPQLDLAMNWPDSYRFVSYREGQGALSIVMDNTTLVDFDSPVLESALVSIVKAPDMEHEILSAESNSSVNVTRNGTQLLLQGPATVDEFLTVIKTVTYKNTLSHPGDPSPLSRTIQFTVSDGLNESIPAFVYLSFSTINNAPFLDANGREPGTLNQVTFFEEQGAISILSPETVLEDIDNTTLAYIQVTITNAHDGADEVLYVEDVTETSAPLTSKHVTFWNFRPEQRYDPDMATLTISGLDTVYEYQEVLKTLKYDNFADEPNSESRMIQFVLSDAQLNRTGVYVSIEMERINDSPYFNSSATVFSTVLDEDVHPLLNPGWSIEEVVSNGLILDDDANSLQGIAIISFDDSNGYWEITWDYTTDRAEYFSSLQGSGMGSGMENETEPNFDGLQPTSGSGFVSSADGSGDMSDSSAMFGGSSMSGTGSASGNGAGSSFDSIVVSGIGSGMSASGSESGMSASGSESGISASGSGIFESGDFTDAPPTTPPPPKCAPTVPTAPPTIEPSFYATWSRLPNTTSITMATLLRVEGNRTRIRFVPNKDFNGQTTFNIVAWDTSNGLGNGDTINATSSSQTDPYSSESVEITLNVLPVNDAPLLSNVTIQLSYILEDDVTSVGNDVSDFLVGVADIDSIDTVFGIAVVEAGEERGTWQISTNGGRDWTSVNDICPYNATVLASEPPGQNRVRFVPNQDFNGLVSFSFLAWDLTSDEPSGTMSVDTTTSDPVTGAFSTTQATAVIVVEPVNDSPVLTPGSRLATIPEDLPVAENEGTLVWDIVDGFYHDVDTESARGIAVRGVDLRFGMWEWKCPDTDVWMKFFGDFLYGVFVPPLPRPEKATLLSGNCSVRFLPDLNFNTLRDLDGELRPITDLPYISVVAWDTTEGAAGEYGVDTTGHNDSILNEYSAEIENVIVHVASVNDITRANITQNGTGTTYSTQYTEEQSFVRIVEPEFVALTDSDHARLASVRIIVLNSIDPHSERLFLDFTALSNDSTIGVNTSNISPIVMNPDTNIVSVTIATRAGDVITEEIQVSYHIYTGEPDSAPSTLTFSAPPGRERVDIAVYQSLLRFVAYSNFDDEPTNDTRLIVFYFDDSEDVNSNVTTLVEVLLLNDNSPLLLNSLSEVEFVEDSAVLLPVASYNLSLTDSDHNEYFFMANATLSLHPVPVSSQENVSVQISSSFDSYNISQMYSPEEGVLRIVGSAPVFVYEAILRTAVYQSTIEEPPPGMRMLTMQVYDGDNHSNVQRVLINVILVNDQVPMVATADTPFLFTERTHPVAISNGLVISDADSGGFLLSHVTVEIDNPLDGGYEILSVIDSDGVNSSYQSSTLLLAGPASVQAFQTTLSTLSYNNMAEEPSPIMRNITVLAYDQDFVSDRGLIQISIELVNDLPVISFPPHELMINYVEGDGQVPIATNATVTDNDHTHLTQLTALIINPLDQPNEFLNVSIAPGVNITSDYNPDSGLLILSGVASLTEYQTALSSLTYENVEANPGFPDTAARMVELVAFDGKNYSLPVQLLVTFESVNDAPMFDLNGGISGTNHSVVFVEEAEPVFLATSDAVLFDIDNTSLAFVRVSIENLLDGEYEILSVSSNTSDELDLAFYSYDNGVLLIEGLDLTVNFERAVASVTYQNLADEPSYNTRVISFTASDGLVESHVAYTTVEMVPVNDPPRLYISGGIRMAPPAVTPTPTDTPTTDMPTTDTPTTDTPTTDASSGSGLGSGGVSGSGIGSGSASGSLESGSGMFSDSSGELVSGSGSGMDSNDTTNMPPTPPQPTLDPSTILDNVTMPDTGDYAVIFIENSPPVAIVDVNGTLIEDDDDGVLVRFEAVLDGVMDAGFEAIFFDSNSLSNSLVAALFTGAPGMGGYLGDDMTCVSGSGALRHERIDIEATLSILEWEEVVRSLRYCHGDEHPVGGSRNVTMRIQDSSLAWSETQTTVIEVVPVNDAPICVTVPNMFTIDEDIILTIPVLQGCFDHEENLTGESISVFSQPPLGQVVVDTLTGELVFIPLLNDYGTRTFAYQACDLTMFCSNPQLITVVINPVNDPPYPFEILNFTVPEDTLAIIPLSQFFGDVEDDLIPNNRYPRVMATPQSDASTVALEDDQNSTLMYMPDQNFFGRDQLSLVVCDSASVCVEITIDVIVESVNDLPEVAIVYPGGVSPAETAEDQTLLVDVMISEVEDRSPVEVIVLSVGNGTAFPNTSSTTYTFEPVTDRLLQTTTIVYTPNQDFYGDDTITIATVDSDKGATEAIIRVFVTYVNDAPRFGVTELTIIEDTVGAWQLPLDLRVTDPEDVLHAGSFKVIQYPENGTLTYNFLQSSPGSDPPPYGVLTYYPHPHFFTPDGEPVTFVLRACDNDTIDPPLCTEATINITVLSDNDAPHLPLLTLTLYEDNEAKINLWEEITDVEEGRPPRGNVFLIEPYPSRGVATYNPTTGYVTFFPHLNEYGIDYVYYNACDSENHCSQLRGEIEVSILEVNDPPVAMDFVHISREDDFDLIPFEDSIYDNETRNLRIDIVVPSDGSYVSEWTTSIGGRLRVYHAHQIITYLPPAEYVGPDSFIYSLCDNCDPRRDAELGRVDSDPQCSRQVEENGGSVMRTDSSVYITCVEARVEIVVANVNDVPTIGDIAGMAEDAQMIFLTPFDNSYVLSDLSTSEAPPYLYRNASTAVFDSDDQQLYLALTRGLNLTLFNLEPASDIDETSLNLKTLPMNGAASVVTVSNRSRISYKSNVSFSGYEAFNYEICDKQRGPMDEPRCAEATARIWVTKEGPRIVSVIADGAAVSNEQVDTDSKISKGDTITMIFSEATNMPPFGDATQTITTTDIMSIFQFDPPFFIDEVTPDPIQGEWMSPTELKLTIKDEGFPVPFISNTLDNVEIFSEIKIGEWKVSASDTVGPCGGFDANGNLLTQLSPYCLQSADENSFHFNSESPELTGDFGLRLPEIGNILVKNTILDETENTDLNKNLQLNSQLSLFLKEPFSYSQLQTYCQRTPTDLLDASALGSSVELSIVGCANLLSDGRVAEEVYQSRIDAMKAAFSPSARRKREVSEEYVLSRERRQSTSVPVAQQPVASEIVLRIDNLVNPSADPTTDPNRFVQLIVDSFNVRTLAEVVSETLGIPVDLLTDYTNTGAQADPFYYFEADDDLTPSIVRVVASDPDNADDLYGAGDVITIFFSVNTDQPAVATKEDLDKILIFDPSLGADYVGRWVSPSVLEITVVDPALGEGVIRPSLEPLNFNLTFTPNYFHTNQQVAPNNAILPTETPWCVGINVCGEETTTGRIAVTIGICSANQLSCRANLGWTNLEGTFGTGMGVSIFPWYWIVVGIAVVVVIVVIIIVVVFCYRYYKHKAERKEALRVVKRWKKEQFTPGGKEEEKKDGPKPWVKPPAVSAMRENPDPFSSVLQKLPEVVPRPPTALTEVENLPPLPQQPPFKPRGLPTIRSSVGTLGTGTPLPRISRTVSGSSLGGVLGLPPLTKGPGDVQQRIERRTTLPPLKGGGALATQARRALGGSRSPTEGGGALPGELLPRSLPPIKPPSSSTLPRPSLGATPLFPVGKGKGPSSGRPFTKKSPPTSSEEDISSSDVAGSGSALPTLSPPFKTTRPLPSINLPHLGGGAALPPIRSPGGVSRPSLPTSPISMPSRRTSVDPFAADPVGPISPTRKTSPAVTLGPRQSLPPLGRAPPTQVSPRAPPTSPKSRVTVSTTTNVSTTDREAGKKERDTSKKADEPQTE